MGASTSARPASTGKYSNSAFWEGLWRGNGLNTAVFLIAAYFIYGNPPGIGAPADALAAFYAGHRTRILIVAIVFGLGVLNLMWFAAAIRSTLREAGQGGWGAAATTSSAALGALFLMLMTVGVALAYSIAGTGNGALTSGLHQLAWVGFVMSAFPRAMLVMSGSFGLWRAGIISSRLFALGVAAVVLGVLSGTTWMSGGFWAPDGAYSRLIFPIVFLAWLVVFGPIFKRAPATRGQW